MPRKKKTEVQPEQTPEVKKPIANLANLKKIQPLKKAEIKRPIPPQAPRLSDNCKAVEYTIRFDDGSVLHAKEEHAEVLFKYISACEADAALYGRFRYSGPPLALYSKDEWEAKQKGK